MIKRFFLILFLALASLALFAQQNANGIRGIVVEEDGTPVMYASVAMIQNGKAAAGALTDTTGLFVMKGTFKGSYQLKITSIGHEDVLKDLMLSDGKSHDLGQTSHATGWCCGDRTFCRQVGDSGKDQHQCCRIDERSNGIGARHAPRLIGSLGGWSRSSLHTRQQQRAHPGGWRPHCT